MYIHFKEYSTQLTALCDKIVLLSWSNRIERVTCPKCKKILEKQIKKGLDFVL